MDHKRGDRPSYTRWFERFERAKVDFREVSCRVLRAEYDVVLRTMERKGKERKGKRENHVRRI